MKKILLSFFLLSIFALNCAYAQSRKITGTVIGADDGAPLPGVSVSVKGTNRGGITDSYGKFTLTASTGETLVVSFIGYNSLSIPVTAANNYPVKLATNNKLLSEVLVVGYGTESKRNSTGAISKVTAEAIDDKPVTGLDQALSGQMAGVSITSSSGTPGGGVTVRIRGVSTINAGSQPLYVVDGTPIITTSDAQLGFGNGTTDPLNDINPNDIESIDVLKDAAAAAIYGSRASNGVVIVTTKRGKAGKTHVDLDYYTGFQAPTREIPTLTGPQYIQILQEAITNRYSSLIGTASYPTLAALMQNGLGIKNDSNAPGTYPSTNWQSLVFNKSAPISNYNLSINGGDEKTKFNVTAGYFKQDGIVRGSDYSRFNFRTNLDHSITDKIKFGTNIAFDRSLQDRINNDNNIYGVLSAGILETSAIPVYNADGTYAKDPNSSVENPVAAYKEPFNPTVTYRLLSNIYGEYQITPYLKFRTNFGADYTLDHERRFLPTTLNAGLPNGSGFETYYSDLNVLNENTLTFNKAFGDHSLNVLLGQSYQDDSWESILASATNFPSNYLYRLSVASNKTGASSSGSSNALISYFARVNYSYKGRYILSASLRDDGSSRFGTKNQYGYFPAFSGAWIISDEPFFKKNDVFSTVKLRGSWGKTGNYQIGDFASRTLVGGGFFYNGASGLAPTQLGTNTLSWEKTTQTDLATDLGFLRDRITLTVDLYKKITTGLLASVPLPGSAGFTGYTANSGSVRNEGLEVDLHSTVFKTSAFTWTTGFNIAFNRNTVLSLANNNNPYGTGFASWVQVGQPLGSFRGYVVDHIFQTQAEIDALNVAAKAKTGSPTAVYQFAATAPGDIKFKDLNGDGVVNSADQKIIGSAQPQFTGGFNNYFKYHDFDLSFFFQFSVGGKLLNDTRQFAEGMNSVFGQYATVLNRWTPTNTNTTMPRAVYGDPNQNTRVSTRFIEDGSYGRLKNLTLGYSLPAAIASKIHVRKVRIFASAQNLFTITKYKGFDPEISTFNDSNTSQGTEFLTVPQAKTITFGANVGF
jgi:TonB-linked SusC/RagA family outer membrane protein